MRTLKLCEKIKRTTALILVLVMSAMLAGCSSKNAEDTGEAVTTGFLEDTVFTVADRRVNLTEWYLYSLAQVAEIENMYGSEIWSFPVDTAGTTMADALKQDVFDQIAYIKIVSGRAEQLGITLNEDEQLDINLQTEEFMSKLSNEQTEAYGITSDIVKSIYEDNVLAMKVYEHLALNIDTNIPDEKVRHMVLEYVMILKDYENEDGEFVRYSDEQLAIFKAEAEQLVEKARNADGVVRLDELVDEEYSVIELIADYSELCEKFPGELPGIIFSLRGDEIDGVYETEDAYFIFDCVSRVDEESTNKAKIEIIEAMQKEVFEEQYAEWEAETVIKYNYKIWDNISLK